jgi:chemotaxis protein histidine kinase CheA
VSTLSSADQFKQSFREEAREVLVDLEAALLELNENRADQELVGRVFRALHTIKGSGSMFGFEDLAAFTHNLETAFDEVRNGRLQIGSDLIDLTLSALDQIRAMLEEREGPEEAAARAETLVKVRKLAGIAENVPKPSAGSIAQAASSGSPIRQWAIRFEPGPDLLLNGSNPLLPFAGLPELGGLSIKASMEMVPPLADLDPERCYVSWDLVLARRSTWMRSAMCSFLSKTVASLSSSPRRIPKATLGKRATRRPGLWKNPVRAAVDAATTTSWTRLAACVSPPSSSISSSTWLAGPHALLSIPVQYSELFRHRVYELT